MLLLTRETPPVFLQKVAQCQCPMPIYKSVRGYGQDHMLDCPTLVTL